MIKRLSAFVLLALAAGCTGGDSFKPNAIISDVEPNTIASGRQARIEISGDFTRWKDTSIDVADIAFGAGITVDTVTVANRGLLYVDITAAPDAVPGTRDVEVDGEVAAGVFNVIAPFEISTPTVSAGGYAFLEIFGNGTDWVDGLTQLTIDSTDVVMDGSDFYGQTGFAVVSPDYIQALIKVDLFATPGAVDVTINGVTNTDAVPALDIAAVTPTVLSADANATGAITGGNEVQVFSIPAGTVGQSFSFTFVNPGTDDAIDALVYDEDDGMNPIANVYNLTAPFDRLFFGNGDKDTYIVVQDYFLAGGNLPYEYDVAFTDLTPAALATQLTGQQLAAAADENWYVVAATKWNVGTITVTAESVTPTISPRIDLMQDYNGLSDMTVAGSGSNNSLTFLQIPGQNLLVGVRDEAGASTGADSAYTIAWNQFAGDALIDAGIQTPVPIPDSGGPVLNLTIDPNTGFTTVTGVHVLLDIRHTYRGDLLIELTSPSGITETVFFDSFDGTDNWITAVPLVTPEDGTFSNFNAETNPDGIWTLSIDDTFSGDDGEVVGWALILEGN